MIEEKILHLRKFALKFYEIMLITVYGIGSVCPNKIKLYIASVRNRQSAKFHCKFVKIFFSVASIFAPTFSTKFTVTNADD